MKIGMLDVLGHKLRLKILRCLANGPLTAYKIVGRTGSNYALVKRHLGMLEESGLVVKERCGTVLVYSLNTNHEVVKALKSFLSKI